ncbi:hypothetical protein [Rhodalgimonas zhirmunskyi]|uniref:Uncharacterized protein n=1 Tax=Rhodalgimonas zhirmunskyi TaxID=2964767 RepID=A0AAJ1X5A4_9RHOB|nr:hypothetical protein [Rhodoalgimonas zhirmunskyi]MDQ2094341.1 hypothetical protein [Rhodoalgimonas zhirmunskyi]
MLIKRVVATGLAIGAVMTAIPAHADEAMDCASRGQVIDRLQEHYAEQLTAGGLNEGAMIEVWASTKTGTFTVLRTDAGGMTCIMATGTDWFAARDATAPLGVKG